VDPQVSIVSAVDHDVIEVAAWFDALGGQSLGVDAEAIVIDPAGNDVYRDTHRRLVESGRPAMPITYERTSRTGRAAALNTAIDRARGEIIVFLADDFLPGPRFAEMHLAFHRARPGVEQVGIAEALIPSRYRREPFTRWLEGSGALFGIPVSEAGIEVPATFFYIGNSSVKRRFLDRVGRFDEEFRHASCDDFELGLRMAAAGMQSSFVEGAGADHIHPLDLPERCLTMRGAGEAARIMDRKGYGRRPEWARVVRFPPAVWRVAGAVSRIRFLATRRERDLFKYFGRRLKVEFSAGYRRRAGSQTPH
jgi:GT2 family glycosyltransferase